MHVLPALQCRLQNLNEPLMKWLGAVYSTMSPLHVLFSFSIERLERFNTNNVNKLKPGCVQVDLSVLLHFRNSKVTCVLNLNLYFCCACKGAIKENNDPCGQYSLLLNIYPFVLKYTRSLYYESRFGVNEVTSGSTQGFLYHDGGSLVTGVDRHGNTC